MLNKKSKYANQTVELFDQVIDAKEESIKKENQAKIENAQKKADKKVAQAQNTVLKTKKSAKKHKIRNTLTVLAAVGIVTTGLVIYNGKGEFNVKNPSEDTHITDNTENKDDKNENEIENQEITNEENEENKTSQNSNYTGSGRKTKSGAYDTKKQYSTEDGDLVDELPQTHDYINNVPSGETTVPSTTNVGVNPGEKSAEQAQEEIDEKIENHVNNGGQVNQIGGGIVVVTTPDNTNKPSVDNTVPSNSTSSSPSVNNTIPSNSTSSSHIDATNVTPDKSKRIDISNYVEEPSDEPSTNTINYEDDLER